MGTIATQASPCQAFHGFLVVISQSQEKQTLVENINVCGTEQLKHASIWLTVLLLGQSFVEQAQVLAMCVFTSDGGQRHLLLLVDLLQQQVFLEKLPHLWNSIDKSAEQHSLQ